MTAKLYRFPVERTRQTEQSVCRRLERAATNAAWAERHRDEFVRLAREAVADARRNGRF